MQTGHGGPCVGSSTQQCLMRGLQRAGHERTENVLRGCQEEAEGGGRHGAVQLLTPACGHVKIVCQ